MFVDVGRFVFHRLALWNPPKSGFQGAKRINNNLPTETYRKQYLIPELKTFLWVLQHVTFLYCKYMYSRCLGISYDSKTSRRDVLDFDKIPRRRDATS